MAQPAMKISRPMSSIGRDRLEPVTASDSTLTGLAGSLGTMTTDGAATVVIGAAVVGATVGAGVGATVGATVVGAAVVGTGVVT